MVSRVTVSSTESTTEVSTLARWAASSAAIRRRCIAAATSGAYSTRTGRTENTSRPTGAASAATSRVSVSPATSAELRTVPSGSTGTRASAASTHARRYASWSSTPSVALAVSRTRHTTSVTALSATPLPSAAGIGSLRQCRSRTSTRRRSSSGLTHIRPVRRTVPR